jgi:hypothetical protein
LHFLGATNTTGSIFGSTGPKLGTGGSIFGQTAQQPTIGGGLFGSTNTALQKPTLPSFGTATNTQSSGLFGSGRILY